LPSGQGSRSSQFEGLSFAADSSLWSSSEGGLPSAAGASAPSAVGAPAPSAAGAPAPSAAGASAPSAAGAPAPSAAGAPAPSAAQPQTRHEPFSTVPMQLPSGHATRSSRSTISEPMHHETHLGGVRLAVVTEAHDHRRTIHPEVTGVEAKGANVRVRVPGHGQGLPAVV
jgi:hypothetical protein